MKTFTILVVDDLPTSIQTILHYLDEADKSYDLLSTTSPGKAIQILQKKKVDLVITDWEMPEMSGLDLIRLCKQQAALQKIPFIVVTGQRTTVENLKQAMDAGAIDFIRKPINKIELWARIDALLKLIDAQNTIAEQKSRELSSKALQVFQQNEILDQLYQQLHKITFDLPQAHRGELKVVLQKIKSATINEGAWDNFKVHFEQVHPSFFNSLARQFPQLNNNDLKWCAYIRIGLSNKEIASLMNIDPNGARVQKNRIKKRLQLSSEQNLDEFIRSIY